MSEIAAKAFVAAQVRLRECIKQMHLLNDAGGLTEGYERDEYIEEQTSVFSTAIQRVYTTMVIMFEDLGLSQSLAEFQKGYSGLTNRLVQLDHFDGQHDLVFNPSIDYLSQHLNLFAPLIEVPSDMLGKRSVLTTMLIQTPTLIHRQPTVPAREKDVQDALEAVLTLAFPDTIREATVAKQTKAYKPDFGIDSIEAAIEVKFIGKETEVGTVLGQLYEDMRGYHKAPDYTLFLGLIYMTSPFVSQARIDAEAAKTNVPKNWHIIVVVGPGNPNRTVTGRPKNSRRKAGKRPGSSKGAVP